MTEIDKDKIAEMVRERVLYYWPDLSPIHGTCLHHTLIGLLELKKHGIDAQMQAGSISWPVIRPEDDDGVCNTHFAMMWEPGHPNSVMARAAGTLPELHTWLGVPETQTLIDFSTHELPRVCKGMTAMEWRSDMPPDYLWVTGGKLPEGVSYRPDLDAMGYAYTVLPELWATRKQMQKGTEE